MFSTLSFSQVRRTHIDPNQRLWATVSGNISNPTYADLTPVKLSDYKLKVYSLTSPAPSQGGLIDGSVIRGNEITDAEINIKTINADSFSYTISHIPFNTRFVLMFVYTRRQNSYTRVAAEKQYTLRGATFSFTRSTTPYTFFITRNSPDILDEISLYKYQAPAPPR